MNIPGINDSVNEQLFFLLSEYRQKTVTRIKNKNVSKRLT